MTLALVFIIGFILCTVSYMIALKNKEVKDAVIDMAINTDSFFKYCFNSFNVKVAKAMWKHSKINTIIYQCSCIAIFPLIVFCAIITWAFVKGKLDKIMSL